MGRKLWFLLFFLALLGCFPVGRDFSTFPVSDIRPNGTTKNQIFSSFGEPQERGLDNGSETWTYYYYVWTPAGLQNNKRLHITFNSDGTVRAYSFSSK
jgi:hypothetical protein